MLIPVDYWKGTQTIDLEYPWITPEAIYELIKLIQSYYDVLEFGCGGSTLFFARRCKSVMSFETSSDWYEKVKAQLSNKQIKNVNLQLIKTEKECIDSVKDMRFDIILVDCVGISRVVLIKAVAPLIRPGGIIIIDNYNADYCKGIDEFLSMKCPAIHSYNDLHWVGDGTRFYHLVNEVVKP